VLGLFVRAFVIFSVPSLGSLSPIACVITLIWVFLGIGLAVIVTVGVESFSEWCCLIIRVLMTSILSSFWSASLFFSSVLGFGSTVLSPSFILLQVCLAHLRVDNFPVRWSSCFRTTD
jgi:fatty acid desaturase